jgi:hypothetical protein
VREGMEVLKQSNPEMLQEILNHYKLNWIDRMVYMKWHIHYLDEK